VTLLAELTADPEYWGTCPNCGADLLIKEAQLFSLADKPPDAAIAQIARLRNGLKERRRQLAQSRQRMTTRAAATAEAVNLGKICEKILPSFAGFPYATRDCRCLWEPIDYIVFQGLSARGEVDSIVFLEAKTGGAKLSREQRQVAAAVAAGKIEVRLLEAQEVADGA
jgi:predicted Holliday junction resolvase-like endonuclease